VYSSDDLRRLFEKMINTRKCPKPAAVSALRAWIASELQVAVEECQYEYGGQLLKGDQMLIGFRNSDEHHSERDKRRQEAVDRCAHMREQLDGVAREWGERIDNWRNAQEQRLADLRKRQQGELEMFERKWQDGRLLQYNKASQRLLTLRKTERRMALFKQFDAARRIKAEADALEREELAEAQKRAVAAIKIKYQNLVLRHKRETDCLLQYTQRNLECYEKTRDEQIKSMEQIVGRLTVESCQQKTPERKKEWIEDAAFLQVSRPVRMPDSARPWRPAQGLGLPAIDIRQHIKVPRDAGQKKRLAKTDGAETG
jgi:hypothetical protein